MGYSQLYIYTYIYGIFPFIYGIIIHLLGCTTMHRSPFGSPRAGYLSEDLVAQLTRQATCYNCYATFIAIAPRNGCNSCNMCELLTQFFTFFVTFV